MRTSISPGLALALLALMWAASHDILKGEPDVRLEWTMIALGAVLAMGVLAGRVRQAFKRWNVPARQRS
jgi:hypothetical protein